MSSTYVKTSLALKNGMFRPIAVAITSPIMMRITDVTAFFGGHPEDQSISEEQYYCDYRGIALQVVG